MCCDTGSCSRYGVVTTHIPCPECRVAVRGTEEGSERRSQRPTLTFTLWCDSVGCEPVTQQHTETAAACLLWAAPELHVKHIVTKTTWGLDNNMWTFCLRGWFILSAAGECCVFFFLKDKYPVRTKMFCCVTTWQHLLKCKNLLCKIDVSKKFTIYCS